MVAVDGILLGLLISILIGPVFFLLINTSMRFGFRAAMILEIGILASDVSYILLAWFGLGNFMLDPTFQYWMGIVGGILVLGFAISILSSKKNPLENEPEPLNAKNAVGLAIKSFLLNSSNPSVIVFWFTTVGLAMKSYHSQPQSIFIYFASCIGTATLLDLVKAYYAKRARQLVNPNSYKWIRLFSGVLLLLLSGLLIGKSLKG